MTLSSFEDRVLPSLSGLRTLVDMIGSLRGRVIELTPHYVLVDIHGVGYRVMVTPSFLSLIKVGEETFFYIHEHIREDMHDLYGFLSTSDLELFDQLLGISGVGPKVAQTILAVGSADTVRRAIMAGDLATLTSVPGVGKKTAQKIILELKGQIVEIEDMPQGDKEASDALQGLGYSANQAREALKMVSPDIVDVSSRVREALRGLSKK